MKKAYNVICKNFNNKFFSEENIVASSPSHAIKQVIKLHGGGPMSNMECRKIIKGEPYTISNYSELLVSCYTADTAVTPKFEYKVYVKGAHFG